MDQLSTDSFQGHTRPSRQTDIRESARGNGLTSLTNQYLSSDTWPSGNSISFQGFEEDGLKATDNSVASSPASISEASVARYSSTSDLASNTNRGRISKVSRSSKDKKAQKRIAQANYRARHKQRVAELEKELETYKRGSAPQIARLKAVTKSQASQIQSSDATISHLKTENYRLEVERNALRDTIALGLSHSHSMLSQSSLSASSTNATLGAYEGATASRSVSEVGNNLDPQLRNSLSESNSR